MGHRVMKDPGTSMHASRGQLPRSTEWGEAPAPSGEATAAAKPPLLSPTACRQGCGLPSPRQARR